MRSSSRSTSLLIIANKMLGPAFYIPSFSFSQVLVLAPCSLDLACSRKRPTQRSPAVDGPITLLTRQKREKGLCPLGVLRDIFGHNSNVKRTKGLAYAFGAVAVLLYVSTSRLFTISWHIHVLHPHWPFHTRLNIPFPCSLSYHPFFVSGPSAVNGQVNGYRRRLPGVR
ncbi:hypothetical protein BJV78DRAFT_1237292 [Lactifluus subvellereus]|nr:hypothetical protein BJV78DRAFT_1263115 [Lactifluus subvellereus]KAI0248289.1 hypothetical protein BJV78DRAFT_1237292 [Lactifluus subvellereus]